MIELFVEGQPVDINESFSTLLTYAIDDIREFGAKNTAFSKTIILPGTKRNQRLFGNILEVSAGNEYNPILPNIGVNFNAAVTASAYIFCDNIQIGKGIIQVLEVIKDNGFDELEVFFTGELGGFAAKLGNKKLEELDFSALDHPYTIANIKASWDTADAGAGYFYPLMDYGNYSSGKANWKYGTFRPALYAKEYIDKIFSGAGYTFDCALFETSRFKSLVIPNNRKGIYSGSSDLLLATVSVPPVISYTGSPPAPPFHYLEFGSTVMASSITTSDNKRFVYGGTQTLEVELKLRLKGTYRGSQLFAIFVYKNTTIFDTADKILGIGLDPSPTPLAFEKEGSITFTLNPGDYFDLTGQSGFDTPLSYDVDLAELFEFSIRSAANELVEISLGDTVSLNTNLPKNILQKDFISSIVKLFNLYIFEDPLNDKVLKIKPFVDFYEDAETEDWSLKLDRSQAIRIKPMSELNSRYYEFNFKDDSDYWNDLYKKRYNQSYGSLVYDSEYEFAKEVEKVEVIFSGTPLVGYNGQDKVYSTIFKRTGNTTGAGEEPTDSNIRLLLAKKITGVTSWDILATDGTTVLASQTTYGYAGHLDDPDAPANDIQFGVPKELFFTLVTGAINVNQFNVYWSSYMAEITDKDSRLLTGTFKLDYRDIYNLDFSKFKYIDGVLFRLNKIIDFNATNEDTCKCELLKVINKTY